MRASELRQITTKRIGRELRYIGPYKLFQGQIVTVKEGAIQAGGTVFWDCVVRGPMGILLGCKAADVELIDEQTEEDGEIALIAS